ncbi:hypothetical protein [Nocardia sp. CDC160]|uniref:hypothetical protein n=1 Tax=Nocardia sp. CDC160 TaxID=3112166 RepID=UPI002DB5718A|nr:hypothetical protein [Nocardia sp. CDC160]MEC3918751.1 hypothetical protein [Nocardia sp. CDC160]
MVASLYSCDWASGGGLDVVDGLTASKARDQCLHYLEQTLGALPKEVFFTQKNRWGGDNSEGLVVDRNVWTLSR